MRKDSTKPPYQMTQLENFKNDPFGYIVMGYYTPKHLNQQKRYAENSISQPNELTRSFYRISGTAQKLFVVVASEFMNTEKTRKNRWVSLELSDTLYSLNIPDGTKQREYFKNAIKEVADLSVILQDDEHQFHYLHLFEELKYDWDWGTLKFKLSEKFALFLEIKHKQGYTLLSVPTLGKLSSFYAMRYYEIAMSYYGFKGQLNKISDFAKENGIKKTNSWFFAYSLEQLRTLFGLKKDEYERTQNFVKRIVEEPISELNNKIPSLKFVVEIVRKHNTKKGKIEGFIFWIQEKSEKLQIKKSDSEEVKNNKREYNDERYRIEKLKEKHKQDWERILDEELKQECLFPEQKEFFAQKNAERRLLELFDK